MALRKRLHTDQDQAKPPVIVLTGGGSGGHITPLLAVADELKKTKPDAQLIYIGQKGDKLSSIVSKNKAIKGVHAVRAGKFRRYHGEGLRQVLDLATLFKNIRDFFYVLIGIWQSYWLIKRLKPDVIFVKGGFVGVPVGLAAAMRHIPFITHDSDAVPGLANRIISRWAEVHAVALPKNVYKYPADKTVSVGVPISSSFRTVNKELQNKYKKQLGLKPSDKLVFVTGGGKGALRLNQTIVDVASLLIPSYPKLVFIHVTGLDHVNDINERYDEMLKKDERNRVKTEGFIVNELYVYSGAADVVITRAGATNIAEFAVQHKACIIVPNPQLTGGHQVKNASYLAEQNAAVVMEDSIIFADPDLLISELNKLLASETTRQKLGNALGKFAKPRAAKDLAELLLDTLN
jgi:UDP-N-acetylglucosamine--N-acetylmuramyl-(pentapeptide) pyrophosphoryl-undecaprenol N-acetylglucosamine transferase